MMSPFEALSGINQILTLSKTAQTAIESIKNADILSWVQNLRQYILELREEIFVLKNEQLNLQVKIKELETQQQISANMKSDGQHYWNHASDGTKDGPFCQPCFDQGQSMRLIKQGSYYFCKKCNYAYGKCQNTSEYF